MGRRVMNGGVLLMLVLLLALVAGAAVVTLSSTSGGVAAPSAATLTIFTGSASVERSGSSTSIAAHTGLAVGVGDTVATAASSKAAIVYSDGSVTRLDSDTRVTVRVMTSGASLKVDLAQSTGLTWNQVKKLVGGSTFKVSGPNNATAEVRGTRFGYYVEHDPAGKPVIWIDTYEGSVLVSGAVGPAVTAVANQRVTVRAGAAPTVPAPIPDADLHLSFTVFNKTIEAVSGTPIAFSSGALDTGKSAGPFTVSADGNSDLQFVLGWPGSIFELTVTDPTGKVFSRPASSTPQLSVRVPRAAVGTWTYSVRDVQSGPQEAWWVVVGRT